MVTVSASARLIITTPAVMLLQLLLLCLRPPRRKHREESRHHGMHRNDRVCQPSRWTILPVLRVTMSSFRLIDFDGVQLSTRAPRNASAWLSSVMVTMAVVLTVTVTRTVTRRPVAAGLTHPSPIVIR